MKSISPGVDLTKPEMARDFMASSASLAEWNENYYRVKRACGVHPMWWLATMFGSGLYASKLAEWATRQGHLWQTEQFRTQSISQFLDDSIEIQNFTLADVRAGMSLTRS